jgi:hypothetical protein
LVNSRHRWRLRRDQSGRLAVKWDSACQMCTNYTVEAIK